MPRKKKIDGAKTPSKSQQAYRALAKNPGLDVQELSEQLGLNKTSIYALRKKMRSGQLMVNREQQAPAETEMDRLRREHTMLRTTVYETALRLLAVVQPE